MANFNLTEATGLNGDEIAAAIVVAHNSESTEIVETVYGANPVEVGASSSGATTNFILNSPALTDGEITSIRLDVKTTGTVTIRKWDKVGDVFTASDSIEIVTTETGVQEFTVSLDVTEGEYVSVQGSFGYSNEENTGWYQTQYNDSDTLTTLTTNLLLEFSWTIASEETISTPTDSVTNYLRNKTLATIGDSMVEGHTLASTEVWDSLISDRNEMTAINYGINGTEITNDNGFGDSVLNRYSLMDDAADYVLVFAGTNDATAGITIGTDSDSFSGGQETFKGALNDLCDGLITKYPDAKIGFITPYNRTTATQEYITAIITMCKLYSIPVFDNWTNGGVCWTNTTQTAAITLGDTYHMNADGMGYVSYKYEQFLRGL